MMRADPYVYHTPAVVRIKLTRGMFAIIDADDLPLVSTYRSWSAIPGSKCHTYYACGRNTMAMHRLILGLGWRRDDPRIVDHANGNGLDNRRCNLRIADPSLNSVNRKRTPGKYLRGVQPYSRRAGKWRAGMTFKGRFRVIGYFETEQEAHDAYVRASRDQHGEWFPLKPGEMIR